MTLAILLVAVFSLFVGVQPAAAASPLAYVSDLLSAAVLVIDTSTNAVVARVPVGSFPSGVAITPDGAFAYVANQGGTVSVIETATNTVVATVPLGRVCDWRGHHPGRRLCLCDSFEPNPKHSGSDLNSDQRRREDNRCRSRQPSVVAITPDGAFAYVTVQYPKTQWQ